jgi:hypothetical protein
MPYANCTDVQLGLCRLGEGWSDSRVCVFLVSLNISAWNILVRVLLEQVFSFLPASAY